MLTLPRFFDLIVHLDGSDIPIQAEAFETQVLIEPCPLGAERAIRGGGMDSNCLIPRSPGTGFMKVPPPGRSQRHLHASHRRRQGRLAVLAGG